MADKLTPAAARALQPGQQLRDSEVTGLELWGHLSRKTWRLYYRTKDGQQRRPSLGSFPSLTIEAARAAARSILTRVASGEDPAHAWNLGREEPTVAEVVEAKLWTHMQLHNKASTVKLNKQLWTYYVAGSALARLRVSVVTLEDVEALLFKVRDGINGKPAPRAMTLVRAFLSKFFNLAETRWKLRPQHTNPVRKSARVPSKRRGVYATPSEMAALGRAISDHARRHPRAAAAIMVMFLTGARPGEIRAVRPEFREGGVWRLREHKTERTGEDRLIEITPSVERVLAGLDRLPPDPSGLLFGHFHARWHWDEIRRAAGLPKLQMRDARRTFASATRSAGVDVHAIQDILGHTDPKTTAIYARLFEDVKAGIAAKSSGQIEQWMNGHDERVTGQTADVPALPGPRARGD